MTVVSPCRAWAVGTFNNGPVSQTLIEMWNGSRWRVQPSPNVGASVVNRLQGVTSTSPTDAWAVGVRFPGSSAKTLIEHWNGTSWSVVPSPNPGATDNDLTGIDALSRTNVWAVGTFITPTRRSTLVEHWNGTKWKVVPSPNVSSNDIGDLFGIDVVTSKNAWAVGYSGPPTARQTLIEHWNGTVWKIQQSPNHAGATVNTLVDVSGVSSTDAWAVGSYMDGSTSRTLIEHWNGSHWTVQPSANVGPNNNELDGVVATSPTNAWAVGVREQGVNKTLVEHWNGTTWKVQQSANVGTGANALADIDASSNSNAWAVGFRDSSGTIQTLALQCC